jgi:hypothetical protein
MKPHLHIRTVCLQRMINERQLDTEIDQIIKLPMHKTVRVLNIDAMDIAKYISRTEIGTYFNHIMLS